MTKTKTDMPYRRLGRAGIKVSALSLGGWTTFGGTVKDDDVTSTIMKRAFAVGINFFDIADVYANGEAERRMGKVLGELPRHELVISSKVFWPMSKDINDRGLVEQPQYSLLARRKVEDDVLPAARALGMGMVVWSPLASGVLTGKYDDGVPAGSRLSHMDWLREKLTEEQREKVKQFKTIADDVGTTRARLALAWALSRPGVSSVITGATSTAQLDENLAALSVTLDDDVKARLDVLFP